MGCDIGKGVTRMLTPSRQQIEFVQAATPIAQSLIAADVTKSQIAASASGYRAPPIPQGNWGGPSATQPATGGGVSGDDIATLAIGATAVVVALILLVPRRST